MYTVCCIHICMYNTHVLYYIWFIVRSKFSSETFIYISGDVSVQTTATIQVRAAKIPSLRLFIRFQNPPSSTFAFLSFLSFFVSAPPSHLPFHLRVSFAFLTRLLLFLPFLVLVVQLPLGWFWMVLHPISGVAL